MNQSGKSQYLTILAKSSNELPIWDTRKDVELLCRTEQVPNTTSVVNPGLNYRALNSIRDTGSRLVIHINKVYAISSSVVRYADNVGMKNV